MNRQSTAGVILAGGRSSRMAGGDKALAPLAGKPLIQHVIERVQPQVRELALSVEVASDGLGAFQLQQLTDPQPGHRGPLGGLLSAMRHFAGSHEWLLLVPCDAPFLPGNLAARLRNCALEKGADCAAVVYQEQLEPTFSIWHRGLVARLERAVKQDEMSGLRQFMATIQTAEKHWPPAHPPPFFNVNDPAALHQAASWIRLPARAATAC